MTGYKHCGWMLGALLAVSPGLARADMLVALVDGIPGDVTELSHKGWVRVSSQAWGLERTGSVPAFQVVTLTLDSGPWSAALAQAAASGQRIRSVVLDRTKSGPSGERVFGRIVLEDVTVRSLATSARPDGDEASSMQLTFATIRWEYYGYDDNLSVLKSTSKGGWSLTKNGPL